MSPTLEAKSIAKSFPAPNGTISVLDTINLALAPGDFVSIQGTSGSGKSTLLLILGGLLHPEKGSVFLCGESLFDCSADRRATLRARHIGFVFQRFHLLPYLTVKQNILSGAITLQTAPGAARADELMTQFDLVRRAEHLPGRLSVGEQQRTALARALFHRPALLLADEPTGNLDPENTQIVLGAIEDFVTDGGAAVLVTHHPECAARAKKRFCIKNKNIEEIT